MGCCNHRFRWLCSLILAWIAAPSLTAAETGIIQGKVDKPSLVTAVTAEDRATDKKFSGKLDSKSGRFTIAGLPLDARYDCLIDFKGGRLEGVNLKVPRSDYEEEQPLSAEDVETIKTKVRGLNKFEDVVDILAVTGNIQHAAVLINKIRTRPFVNSQPGEVIWRTELWHFERPEETWVKVQDELFLVLYRERIRKSVYDKKAITFDPALGGCHLTRSKPSLDLGLIKLPPAKPGIRIRSRASPAGSPGK